MDCPTSMEKRQTNHNILQQKLIDLSVDGLIKMFDREKELFCYTMIGNDYNVQKEGVSIRYTIISLLGLKKLEDKGIKSPINITSTLSSLCSKVGAYDNLGDIGLLIWLCSLVSPDKIERIFSELDLKNTYKRYPDAAQGRTMELAWFLTGLSYAKMALTGNPVDFDEVSKNTYKMLLDGYGGKGIFRHQSDNTFIGFIRNRVGTFADQVYPVYAFTKYSLAYGDLEAKKIALECAKTICKHQGSLGQWCWHYDSVTGNLVGQYPVYSVHQDAMAPMALFAIGDLTGVDFTQQIYKGLYWITGENELKTDLISTSMNVIWRSFYRNKYKTYFDEFLTLFNIRNGRDSYKDLTIWHECRPYHLGWILYAFADR